jgi:hypothetical protein
MRTDGTTFITPLGLAFTVFMGALMLALPRRYALAPVIILSCYMTMGERVMIGPFNFTMIRILLLLGWLRLATRREIHGLKLNSIDTAVVLWVVSSLIMHTLLWQNSQEFINRLGVLYDTVGLYFMFRYLLRGLDDILQVLRMLAVFLAPLAAFMILEKMTGRNIFYVFGGVPEFTEIRDGVLRCQGPFAHPILAGTFGATSFALGMGLWWQGRSTKILAVIAIVACLIVIITSGSSGPVLAGVAALVGMAMWGARRYMRQVRWGIVLSLIGLHLYMKDPVWFLIARMDVFSASTGYHRAKLIDHAITNFGDWWLVGTKSTAAWSDDLFDVTNAYILEGANGGLVTMILFITIIVLCFSGVGKAIRAFPAERRTQLLWWAAGSALLAHAVTFLSVSYFDQNIVVWFLLLALISTSTALVRSPGAATSIPAPELDLAPVQSLRFGSEF